jgi:hypothetical protein
MGGENPHQKTVELADKQNQTHPFVGKTSLRKVFQNEIE